MAAILSADAYGFAAELERDEAATALALVASRRVLRAAVESAGGRVVDAVGDNLLAVFASAVDAVRGALDAQGRLAADPSCGGLRFRIGLTVGDVMVDDTGLFGDAIAVAARLQAIAPPGGIVASATLVELSRNKLPAAFRRLGRRRLKNLAQVPGVYLVTPPAEKPTRGLLGGGLAGLWLARLAEAGSAVVIVLLLVLIVLVLDLHADIVALP